MIKSNEIVPSPMEDIMAKLMIRSYKNINKAAKEVFKYHKVIYYNSNGYIVSRPKSVLEQMGAEYFEMHGCLSLLPKRKKSRVARMRGSDHVEISLVDNSSYYPVKFETYTGVEGDVFLQYSQKVSNLLKGD